MAGDTESKKKHRKVLRASFTKAANELEAFLKAKEPVYSDTEISWECLKLKFDELHICNIEVYEGLLESATEEQLVAEMESCDAYVRRFTELRLRCTKVLQPRPANDGVSVEKGNSEGAAGERVLTGKRKFKLPKIEFKHYDGNIRDWLAFWSQFRKIHEDTDIDDSDKIEYLVQATVPGSRARQLVESFPVIGENYKKIVECMQARFGREDLQIEVYVRELLKLVLRNTMSYAKLDISMLYDQLETQLRALDTLGITSDKYAAMLFPLIESCLPQDLLRIWQRSSYTVATGSHTSSTQSLNGDSTLEIKLKNLMSFLRSEVENEQRICLASEGFGLSENLTSMKSKGSDEHSKKRSMKNLPSSTATAAGLINTDVAKCIFCMGSHRSDVCFKAQKMTLDDRKNILNEKRACFRCLKVGHLSRKCRSRLRCISCGQSHVPLMCPSLAQKNNHSDDINAQNVESVATDQALTNQTNKQVFLQTLQVTLKGNTSICVVRALIDSGSQRSYILKSTALKLGLKPKRAEKIVHCLFGGTESTNNHYCYDVMVSNDNYTHSFEVLDQPYICNEVSPIFCDPWMNEIRNLKVHISDLNNHGPIELLLGADVAEILYTGRSHKLQCGLMLIETCMGWTVMGKVSNQKPKSNDTMSVLSMFVNPSITDLWQLDVLGIQEPTEKISKEERAFAAKELFLQTVTVEAQGRYEVRLPWLDGHPPLPTNYNVAKRRLEATVRKLERDRLFIRYDEVFKEWEALNIIERIKGNMSNCHYMPHRPVLKEGSTTAIRPVFDASAHENDKPSLNQCLEKGPNLIEQIPTLLLRFRESKIGVISDIKKAFLQISVHQRDRDFLRFLWVDEKGQEMVFRHRRVVFGVNCSPFLLGATIEHHLSNCLGNYLNSDAGYSRDTIEKLSKSFYVDNCVTNLPDQKSANKFIRESVLAMAEGQFELRGWEVSGNPTADDYNVSVLGLTWFPKQDVITISQNLYLEENTEDLIITKRRLLSMAQKIFDPIGFTAPVTLVPKLLLQRLWEKQTSWDSPVEDDIAVLFKNWINDLHHLFKIKIPRWVSTGRSDIQDMSIHTFCDACQDAFATVVYCRVVKDNTVSVHLLAAKSRVAPLRKLTIPRLELMGATIGSRLYTQVKESLEGNFDSFFWSDSSTVISWIQRNEEWGTFVWNRVNEIRHLTQAEQWRHIPGACNPADLPSRGCTSKQLLDSKWWEGPGWLYQGRKNWPNEIPVVDEEGVAKERKKKLVTSLVNVDTDFWHLSYFSKFTKTVRMIAWIFRYINNVKNPDKKHVGDITVENLNEAEKFIFRVVQKESFSDLNDKRISCLNAYYDIHGLIRLKSRVSNREDKEGYRFPIVLPAKHPVVESLVMDVHRRLCRVGTQGLLSHLRENFWILGGRRTIKSVLMKCGTCKRLNSKPFIVETPPLPVDRVRDAVAFEITGVDFAGPLYLKTGDKAWICLFTCAVYRAVHMELSLSLSTSNFLQVLRRFVARRGRPKILYSDNGTNFRGTDNAFAELDWQQIMEETSIQRIIWRFNPPSAAWWGGFFERLIGIVKQLLRRVLGRACLYYEELLTIICDCEAVVNSRPLTYISNDPKDLIALTPAMFLRDQADADMPDCDQIDKRSLLRRVRNQQKLRNDLRQRFRLEYLGQLKLMFDKRPKVFAKLGDIVLIENDSVKRIEWPIGRVMELIPGKDGQIRLVRVKTARGNLLRPVQRLFPLGCNTDTPEEDKLHVEESSSVVPEPTRMLPEEQLEDSGGAGVSAKVFKSRVPGRNVNLTRSGRVSQRPQRYL